MHDYSGAAFAQERADKARKESELWRDRFNESDRWRAIEHGELVEAVADIRRLIAENNELCAEVERLKRSSNIIAGQRNESDRRYFAARAAAKAWKRSAKMWRWASTENYDTLLLSWSKIPDSLRRAAYRDARMHDRHADD